MVASSASDLDASFVADPGIEVMSARRTCRATRAPASRHTLRDKSGLHFAKTSTDDQVAIDHTSVDFRHVSTWTGTSKENSSKRPCLNLTTCLNHNTA